MTNHLSDQTGKIDLRPTDDPGPHPVYVTAKCNQRCVFCAGAPSPFTDRGRIERALFGADWICLQGGEPTIDRLLFHYVKLAKRDSAGRKITLATNGLKLSLRHYARACANGGLDEILLSFPAHRSNGANPLCPPQAYDQKIRALRNLNEICHTMQISLLHPVCTANYRDLPELFRFLYGEFAPFGRIVLKLVECVGRATHKPDLLPPMDKLGPRLEEALALADQWGMPVSVEGIPPCLYPAHAERTSLKDSANLPFAGSPKQKRRPQCAGCPLSEMCCGVSVTYLERHGATW